MREPFCKAADGAVGASASGKSQSDISTHSPLCSSTAVAGFRPRGSLRYRDQYPEAPHEVPTESSQLQSRVGLTRAACLRTTSDAMRLVTYAKCRTIFINMWAILTASKHVVWIQNEWPARFALCIHHSLNKLSVTEGVNRARNLRKVGCGNVSHSDVVSLSRQPGGRPRGMPCHRRCGFAYSYTRPAICYSFRLTNCWSVYKQGLEMFPTLASVKIFTLARR